MNSNHTIIKSCLLLVAFFCATTLLAPLSTARAEKTYTGGSVSFTLPDGWKADYDSESDMFSAMSEDEECGVVLMMFNSDGMSEGEWAARFAESFGSPPPKKIEGFSNYSFDVNMDGQPGIGTVVVVGYKGMMFVELGKTEKYKADIDKIWYSLSSTELAENNLFKSLE